MSLYSLTIAQGIQILFLGEDILFAIIAILMGIPSLVTAYSLWTGKYWSYKALILTFVMYFLIAIYVFWNEDDIAFTELLLLLLVYIAISLLMIRYVYKNVTLPFNKSLSSDAENGAG